MKENNKGVIVLLIVIIVMLVALCVLFATGTISLNVNNNNDKDNNEINVNRDESNKEKFDELGFEIEDGFTKINLTENEKKVINKELFNELRPSSTISLFNGIFHNNTKEDILADDCNKISFAFWYITFNNKAKYETKQYTITKKDELGNDETKIKYSRLVDITKEMFNVSNLSCTSYVKPDKDGYIWFQGAGGGEGWDVMKIVSKYRKDNIYYDIIHMYEVDSQKCNSVIDCIDDPDDVSNENGVYIKLKYGIKDNNQKYLISAEYLK